MSALRLFALDFTVTGLPGVLLTTGWWLMWDEVFRRITHEHIFSTCYVFEAHQNHDLLRGQVCASTEWRLNLTISRTHGHARVELHKERMRNKEC